MDWRQVIPTSKLSEEEIHTEVLAQLPIASADMTQVTICSVVPEKKRLLAETFQAAGLPCHLVSHLSELPIRIDYPSPSQIGPDRLANAAALAPLNDPAIVIDFGTAVTFDVLSPTQGGTYLGGVIAPGLGALCDDLHQRTALLPQITLNEPASAIGKSTEHAMQVGAVIGYRGLIREILHALAKELPGKPTILATGGDAELIAAGLPEITRVDSKLTLQGILQIALLNPAS